MRNPLEDLDFRQYSIGVATYDSTHSNERVTAFFQK